MCEVLAQLRARQPRFISSSSNASLKAVLRLRKSRLRRLTGTFLLEGLPELERALAAGYTLIDFLYCPELLSEVVPIPPPAAKVWELSEAAFKKIAIRENLGFCAVLEQQPVVDLQALLEKPGLILAVEGVEKPGNLGALLRTADGAGVAGVVLVDSQVDLYNPQVLRASLGAAFTMQVGECKAEQLREVSSDLGLPIVLAALPEAKPYYTWDFRKSCVLVLGSEAWGLSSQWLDASYPRLKIPMLGDLDSLNVAVAGGVFMYEAQRQRSVG